MPEMGIRGIEFLSGDKIVLACGQKIRGIEIVFNEPMEFDFNLNKSEGEVWTPKNTAN